MKPKIYIDDKKYFAADLEDGGLYVTFDRGVTWAPVQNAPEVVIGRDLERAAVVNFLETGAEVLADMGDSAGSSALKTAAASIRMEKHLRPDPPQPPQPGPAGAT